METQEALILWLSVPMLNSLRGLPIAFIRLVSLRAPLLIIREGHESCTVAVVQHRLHRTGPRL